MPNLQQILHFVESKGIITIYTHFNGPYKLNIKEINEINFDLG